MILSVSFSNDICVCVYYWQNLILKHSKLTVLVNFNLKHEKELCTKIDYSFKSILIIEYIHQK